VLEEEFPCACVDALNRTAKENATAKEINSGMRFDTRNTLIGLRHCFFVLSVAW
jgi:hypothetical protein